MPEEATSALQRLRDDPGALWDDFCESLKSAGEVLRRDATPKDELTLAEGHRHLIRMLRAGFENVHEMADTAHPVLAPMVGPLLQYEGTTSDARYLHGFIDGRRRYRVSGTRGAAPLIEIGVYTGKQGMHEKSHLLASLTEEQLELGDDGRLEVYIGPEPVPGNWIETDERARYMMIRQYAHDWSGREEGVFRIECLDDVPARAPLSAEAVRAGLEDAVSFVRNASLIWAGISDYWAGFAVNRFVAQLDADTRTDIAPPSGHHFSCGYFRIAPDEALVARFRPAAQGDFAYWSLGLASYWYETIGWGCPESQLNSGTAQYGPDGWVRAVIAHRDPGTPNWIDPKGHCEGTLVFRWSRSKAPVPPIETTLVRVAAL
jgi:hypothetical protein